VGLPAPPSAARRAELADFLRTRRAALSPADVGLDPGEGRRRTPGLRREEVAQRSGVGLSWYTWLEQGRDVTPSGQVLLALSRALALSPSERDHLFLLAGVAPPPGTDGPVDAETAAFVDGLLPHVAFVLTPRFDVAAHNRAAELIMGDLVAAPPGRRNLLLWMFDEDAWPGGGEGWERTARANLLDFRTEYARHPGDPAFVSLVERLSAGSATFRAWWAGHDVQVLEPTRKQITHPALGRLSFLSAQSRLAHAPWLRLRMLVPADARTRHLVGDLCAGSAPSASGGQETSALGGQEASALGGQETSALGGQETSALGGQETSALGGQETSALGAQETEDQGGPPAGLGQRRGEDGPGQHDAAGA
jgi:transcriptional regulator with XRE-family HTH domain